VVVAAAAAVVVVAAAAAMTTTTTTTTTTGDTNKFPYMKNTYCIEILQRILVAYVCPLIIVCK
jgi:hypothetical protein